MNRKSFGARFSEKEYIKVDVDFEMPRNDIVTKVTEKDGTPVTTTGTITWNNNDPGIS